MGTVHVRLTDWPGSQARTSDDWYSSNVADSAHLSVVLTVHSHKGPAVERKGNGCR